MKLKIKEGTTSKLCRIFVQDSSKTDGSGLTGLSASPLSTGLVWHWIAEGDATVQDVTFATATVGTYTSGGFKEVDATKLPGVYEIGIPNDAIDATSEGSVVMMLHGATNMAPVAIEIELDAVDYQDATAFGLSRLDATVSSRLDTLGTNAPANWINAAAIAASALDGKGDWLTTLGSTAPAGWIDAAAIAASALNGKGDWLTTLGSTAPAGWIDAASIAAAALNGKGDWALASLYTASRAGYLDNLNVGGNVASAADLSNITNNTRAVITTPTPMVRPSTASTDFKVRIALYDTEGNAEAPDSAPTIAAEDAGGTSLNANLSSTTMSLISTGYYEVTYNVPSTHDLEQVNFAITVVEGTASRVYPTSANVTEVGAAGSGFNAADRTKLDALHDDRLTAARAGYLDKLNVTGTLAHSDAASTYKATGFSVAGDQMNLADGAITASKIAASALDGKGDWLTTLGATAPVGWINAAAVAASALNGKGDWLLSTEDGSSFTSLPWNPSWDAEVQSECDDALRALFLHQLLAADYDAAAKPGVASALLNEMVEDDLGVTRFTGNALEQAPSGSGGDATSANQATILARLGAFTGTAPNDILGFLRAIMRNDASTPTDVGGTFNPANHSEQGLRSAIDGLSVGAGSDHPLARSGT